MGSGVHNLSLIVRAHNRASRALASVGRDLDLLDRARARVGRGFQAMSSMGLLAIKALAVGVVIALGGAIFAFARFDDAMAGSLAIVDEVSPQIREQLENTAREVAKTTIFSATEAAAAYFNLFSAGQTVAQAMESLPVVAQFAQAGLFDLEKATEALVTVQNALGLAFEDPIENMEQMQRIADVLAKADMTAVGTIEEFADALTNRAAAAMRTYNIDVEEGVAVLAAWAMAGLKGKTAGEAFSIVTRDLQKAALKEADAWRAAGAAVFDHSGNMRNLADIIGDLERAMDGLSDAGKKQLLMDLGFQERSQARLLQLIGSSDEIREFEAAFRSAGGAVEEVAEKQLDSPIKQLILLKNAIVDLFIGAGKSFDESFTNVIIKVRTWVNDIGPQIFAWADTAAAKMSRFGEISGRVWERLTNVGSPFVSWEGDIPEKLDEIVTSVEGLITKFQELPDWLQKAAGEWAKLIPMIILASGAIRIVGFVLGLIGGAATVTAAVIAGIIIFFKTAYEQSEEFRRIVGGVMSWFNETAVPAFERAWVFVQERWSAFVTWVLEEFWPGFLEWANRMMTKFNDEIRPALEGLWVNIQTAWASFQLFWAEHGQMILDMANQIWDFFVNTFIPDVITVISDLATATNDALTDINTWWTENQATVEEVLKGIQAAWDFFHDTFVGVWEILAGILTDDWDRVWNGMGLTVEAVFEGIVNAVIGAVNIIIGAINVLIGALNAINPISDLDLIPSIGMVDFNSNDIGRAVRERAKAESTRKGFGQPAFAGTGVNTPGNSQMQAVVFRPMPFGNQGIDSYSGERVTKGSYINIEKIESKADPKEVANEISWKIMID